MSANTSTLVFFSSPERDARILSLQPRVNYLARSFSVRLSYVSLDELRSAGWVGAIRAVDRYEPGRSALAWFATAHIRGAIQDYLRSMDPLSRDHRRKRRAGGLDYGLTLSIDVRVGGGKPAADRLSDPRGVFDLARIEARHDVDALLRRAVLKPRTAEILRRYYAGETQAELARCYGVNESRVCQICKAGIAALRAAA